MWRWVALALLVVTVSGAAAWVAITPPSANTLSGLPFPAPPKSDAPSGKVALEPSEEVYQFGVMPQLQKGRHQWVIRNEGPGDLTLTGDKPYCSCTVLSLQPGEKKTLKPGETFPVDVEFETRTYNGPYEKSARIFTSDPKHENIVFTVRGRVYPPILIMPEEGHIQAGTLLNDQARVFHAAIASADRPETKVLSVTPTRPDLLEINRKPLTAEEIKTFRLDGGGEHLEITVKPTEKLGPFSEEILVKTDHPLKEEVRLTITGKIVGPISAMPPQVRMPDVGQKGRTEEMSLWVQGQDSTHFEVVSAPPNVKVAVAPADDKAQGKPKASGGHRYRLMVTVPPGTPPGVIDAPIVLKTDHPGAGVVELPVQITVLGEG